MNSPFLDRASDDVFRVPSSVPPPLPRPASSVPPPLPVASDDDSAEDLESFVELLEELDAAE